jgi:hypothetical protein
VGVDATADRGRTGQPGGVGGRRWCLDEMCPQQIRTMTSAFRGDWRQHFGGEFDPGSGSTLAACLMHASRTGSSSDGLRGGRVRNTWATCPEVGDNPWKRGVRPHVVAERWVR